MANPDMVFVRQPRTWFSKIWTRTPLCRLWRGEGEVCSSHTKKAFGVFGSESAAAIPTQCGVPVGDAASVGHRQCCCVRAVGLSDHRLGWPRRTSGVSCRTTATPPGRELFLGATPLPLQQFAPEADVPTRKRLQPAPTLFVRYILVQSSHTKVVTLSKCC